MYGECQSGNDFTDLGTDNVSQIFKLKSRSAFVPDDFDQLLEKHLKKKNSTTDSKS